MTSGGGIVIDTSINLTTIIAVVVWLVTIAIAWTKLGGRMDMLEFRIANIEEAIKKIADVFERQSTNEKQLLVLQEQQATSAREISLMYSTIEQLRKGEGWITGPRRGNLEGEYTRP